MKEFKDYDKLELFKKIDLLSIERERELVITKYDNSVLKVTSVSNRYEIFDISNYLKDKIEYIEKNFNIKKYHLFIKGGIQSLTLLSDDVRIGGVDFNKSFSILNSSDRTRSLSFNVGLKSKSNDFYTMHSQNNSLNKKHLNGVTKLVNDLSDNLNDETFDEQIKSIESLVGHKISLSKIREIIIGDNLEVPKVNHYKFDAFKNIIRSIKTLELNDKQSEMLLMKSLDIKKIDKFTDFDMDAFLAFRLYMSIFNKQDSHIVKNETERIMHMTKWAVRDRILEELGI